MKLKIATPVSSLLNATELLPEILELSDVLEVREYSRVIDSKLPRIYHCDWSIVDKWSDGEEQEIANMINNNKPELVTFHVNSCYAKPPVEDGMFQPKGDKFSREQLIAIAGENLQNLEKRLKVKTVFGVENTNYYPTGAYEIVTEPEFLNELMSKYGLKLLLDIAHARVTSVNHKVSFDEYLQKLNLKNAVQFHLSHAGGNEKLFRDLHEVLEDEDWELIKSLVKKCPNLEYLTLEYYKNDHNLLEMLKKLKELVK